MKDIKEHMTKPEMVTVTLPISHLAVAFNAMLFCGAKAAGDVSEVVTPSEWSDHERAALLQAIHEFHKILDQKKVGKRGN